MAEVVMSAGSPISGRAPKRDALYLRIRNDLAHRIDRGEYAAGTALPSENELAQICGTTRLTIRSALDGLIEQGALRVIQGKGAFVCGKTSDQAGAGGVLAGFRESMRRRGHEGSVRLLAKSKRLAGDYYAQFFDIKPDDYLYSIRRLNCIDGVPTSIENTLIPLPTFPTIESVDIAAFSLYETYGILGHPVAEAHQKLGIALLDAHDARLLRVDAKSPALVLECLTVDECGCVIEYARSINCGRRGGFTYRF